MTTWLVAVLMLTALPDPSLAQADGDGSKAVADRRICRPVRHTGSRMMGRDCRSQAEWARVDAAMKASPHEALRDRRGDIAFPTANRR
ncbi:hypothetical protein [Sphingomonas sp. BK235]|uniref:hypothetical protein n=1 Tax=Sphingomonas sp. BK235 TaxID=2512131 RepID=UPI00104EC8F7|nr:hypothetical protein [Sphingomonas sp. BK235]TCP36788.1 hypothetical protein EV292_101285 [Sphingomonas sp. BK235]